jgi:hypothetical protein
VYVAVHAAVPSAGRPAIAPVCATLLARPAVPQVVRYSVHVKKFLGPQVDIDVSTLNGSRLPALKVVLRDDADPADPDDGVTVYSYAGGTPTAVLHIEHTDLFDGYLRLFARPAPGYTVEVRDPTPNNRHVMLS